MNYESNDKIFSKLNQIEVDKIGKRVMSLQPEICFRSFPENDILNHREAVLHLRSKTNLDENTIEQSLDKLISEKKIITARTPKGLRVRKIRKLS
jgi:hypothetical protein